VSPQRRPLLLAALAVLIAVIALAVALTGSGDDGTAARPPDSGGSPADQRLARDRTAIAELAAAYQRALDPDSSDNPCRYMTDQAAAVLENAAREAALNDDDLSTTSPATCAEAARLVENEGDSVPLHQAVPPGVTNIQFRQRVPVAGVQGQAPGAIATWRAAGYGQVSLVRDRAGQWKIAE
jgi:hypothetical protein